MTEAGVIPDVVSYSVVIKARAQKRTRRGSVNLLSRQKHAQAWTQATEHSAGDCRPGNKHTRNDLEAGDEVGKSASCGPISKSRRRNPESKRQVSKSSRRASKSSRRFLLDRHPVCRWSCVMHVHVSRR